MSDHDLIQLAGTSDNLDLYEDPVRSVTSRSAHDGGSDNAVGDTAVGDTSVGETAAAETAVEDTAVGETAAAETAVEDAAVEETAVEDKESKVIAENSPDPDSNGTTSNDEKKVYPKHVDRYAYTIWAKKPVQKAEPNSISKMGTPSSNETNHAAIREPVVEVGESSNSARNIPPHLRPGAQTQSQPQQGSRNSRTSNQRSSNNHRFSRQDVADREEAARMHVQLLSLEQSLVVEQNKNISMRKTIEAEQQQKSNAAFKSMLSNLLRDQEAALSAKARAEAIERDLEYRSRRIEQMELYLSLGRTQLWRKLHNMSIYSIKDFNYAHMKEDAHRAAQKDLADQHGLLTTRMERVKLRESMQMMHGELYKTLIRDAGDAERREAGLSSEQAREIADVEYKRGFADGKKAGLKSEVEPARKTDFLEGYDDFHRAQTAFNDLHPGCVPEDYPKLNFLYDMENPENFPARGIENGQMNRGASTTSTFNGGNHRNGGNNNTHRGAGGAGPYHDNASDECVPGPSQRGPKVANNVGHAARSSGGNNNTSQGAGGAGPSHDNASDECVPGPSQRGPNVANNVGHAARSNGGNNNTSQGAGGAGPAYGNGPNVDNYVGHAARSNGVRSSAPEHGWRQSARAQARPVTQSPLNSIVEHRGTGLGPPSTGQVTPATSVSSSSPPSSADVAPTQPAPEDIPDLIDLW